MHDLRKVSIVTLLLQRFKLIINTIMPTITLIVIILVIVVICVIIISIKTGSKAARNVAKVILETFCIIL